MSGYSYTRTSTVEEQEEKDLESLLEQENLRLQTYALAHGMHINNSFVDSKLKWSVEFAKRSKVKQMLEMLEPGDVVLACSIERIFSSCEDMQAGLNLFKEMRVRLFILELSGEVTAAEFNPSFNRLLDVFHSLEKRRSTERIKTVKQSQRNKGRFLGGSRPFGYMIHSNGRLIENPMEQRVLKKIIKMKKDGKSLRAISSEVSTPMVPISFKTVQRLLKKHEAAYEAVPDSVNGPIKSSSGPDNRSA
ncbi:recombinase family protein [Gammaproteobacteria bacterium]|nr:recombinase family protein [Gammaproteobacteria bacterium]